MVTRGGRLVCAVNSTAPHALVRPWFAALSLQPTAAAATAVVKASTIITTTARLGVIVRIRSPIKYRQPLPIQAMPSTAWLARKPPLQHYHDGPIRRLAGFGGTILGRL